MAAPVTLFATFTALPERAETVRALLHDYGSTVQREEGNSVFAASQLTSDPHKFFVYEEYVDQAAFERHLAATYGAVFNAALEPLIVEPHSELTFLERL